MRQEPGWSSPARLRRAAAALGIDEASERATHSLPEFFDPFRFERHGVLAWKDESAEAYDMLTQVQVARKTGSGTA